MSIKKILQIITDPTARKSALFTRGFYNHLSDEQYIKKFFKFKMGYDLDLNNPKTFNEKLQWLKLHDHNEKYSRMVDKVEAKKYVSQLIGEKYIIPTIAVWNKAEDIDFDILPDQFVLKCTHNSGMGLCICNDKNQLDKKKVLNSLNKGLKQNYYLAGREWPYKNIKPRIIAEKYLEDYSGDLVDYKFFCFDGNVNCVMVCTERATGEPKFYFFDQQWNLLRLNKRGKEAPEGFTLPKPDNMDEMFNIASILSKGLLFVRVDLYDCNGSIYFGELTFYPDSGFDPNLLSETDRYFGDLIKL